MITLRGSIDIHDHPEFTWNGSGVHGAVNITHNRGKRPEMVNVLWQESGAWISHPDIFNVSGQGFGWWKNFNGSTNNMEQIYLYRNNAQINTGCRIRLYFFSTPNLPVT